MADYTFNVKPVGSLSPATGTEIENGEVLILCNEDAYRAPAAVMKGEPGDPGKSAYGVWLGLGFVGSESDFLNWLKGAAGPGAYDTAVKNGFTGSEEEWLKSLKGEGLDYNTMTPQDIANITGKSAYDVAVENGFAGTEVEWLASLQGTFKIFAQKNGINSAVFPLFFQYIEELKVSAVVLGGKAVGASFEIAGTVFDETTLGGAVIPAGTDFIVSDIEIAAGFNAGSVLIVF